MLNYLFVLCYIFIGVFCKAQTTKNIYFDFDKYNLKTEAITILNEVSKDAAIKEIEIKAFTDSVGNIAYNNALSLKRLKQYNNFYTQNLVILKLQFYHLAKP